METEHPSEAKLDLLLTTGEVGLRNPERPVTTFGMIAVMEAHAILVTEGLATVETFVEGVDLLGVSHQQGAEGPVAVVQDGRIYGHPSQPSAPPAVGNSTGWSISSGMSILLI